MNKNAAKKTALHVLRNIGIVLAVIAAMLIFGLILSHPVSATILIVVMIIVCIVGWVMEVYEKYDFEDDWKDE